MDFKGEGDQIRATARVAPTIQRLRRPVQGGKEWRVLLICEFLVLLGVGGIQLYQQIEAK